MESLKQRAINGLRRHNKVVYEKIGKGLAIVGTRTGRFSCSARCVAEVDRQTGAVRDFEFVGWDLVREVAR